MSEQYMLSDSHCHVLDPRLAHRADEIVKNLPSDGLAFIVEISASVTESPESLKFAESHDNVWCTIGVHPHMIHEYSDEFERWALAQKGRPKIAAFGECGLDYHHCPHPREMQKEIFARQIMLADALGLPLVVHTREAFPDTLDVLIAHKKFIKNGLLIHCFSERAEQVSQIREHFDTYFAFGGSITYTDSAEVLRAVPLDRMLLETDAPYLNPIAAGGKKQINEPKNVRCVAEHIAGVLSVPVAEIAAVTLENTKRFYRLD